MLEDQEPRKLTESQSSEYRSSPENPAEATRGQKEGRTKAYAILLGLVAPAVVGSAAGIGLYVWMLAAHGDFNTAGCFFLLGASGAAGAAVGVLRKGLMIWTGAAMRHFTALAGLGFFVGMVGYMLAVGGAQLPPFNAAIMAVFALAFCGGAVGAGRIMRGTASGRA